MRCAAVAPPSQSRDFPPNRGRSPSIAGRRPVAAVISAGRYADETGVVVEQTAHTVTVLIASLRHRR
jgi:hypothetical protein